MHVTILVKLTILSIVCTLGVGCLLLACILPNSYWPLLNLVFYVFLPVPVVVATACNQYESSTRPNELALFITGVLFVSTFGLPVIIHLKGYIGVFGLICSLASNVIFICTAIVYALLFHRGQREFH